MEKLCRMWALNIRAVQIGVNNIGNIHVKARTSIFRANINTVTYLTDERELEI